MRALLELAADIEIGSITARYATKTAAGIA